MFNGIIKLESKIDSILSKYLKDSVYYSILNDYNNILKIWIYLINKEKLWKLSVSHVSNVKHRYLFVQFNIITCVGSFNEYKNTFG